MNKNIEKMSDTTGLQETIKDEIEKIYKADVESIRNLGLISKKLMDGGLEIPGNVMIKGNLTVDNDSNVKGQTTINKLYGGQSTSGSWRDIIVNGGHVRFVVGSNKFGFHNNTNGLHYYRDNTSNKLPIYKGAHMKGNLHVDDHTYTKRLDIKGARGTTHFNHANGGKTYFRDTIDDTSNIRNGLQPSGNYIKANQNVSILGIGSSNWGDNNKERHLTYHSNKGANFQGKCKLCTNSGEHNRSTIMRIQN